MRFLRMVLAHARIAARQHALWAASAALCLLSLAVMVNGGMPFESGDVFALPFFAQVLAMLPPIAYAAACTDLASSPARLGIGEVEKAAPVASAVLAMARVTGALAVVLLPSLALLLLCGFAQLAHGNLSGPLQALAMFALVVVPAALLAAAFSAFAGAALPRAFARIVAVGAWLAALALTSFVGVPEAGGGVHLEIASDPALQALFGLPPVLNENVAWAVASASPLAAFASVAGKVAVAVALLAAAGALSRARGRRR